MPIIKKTVDSYPMTIFVAGDIERAKILCREFCDVIGWCVTITPMTYVYRGSTYDETTGRFTPGDFEDGMAVGIINYAKYPQHPSDLWDRAEHLAEHLAVGLYQLSCSIQGPRETVHYQFDFDAKATWRDKTFAGPDHTLADQRDPDGLVTFIDRR